jgi:hypothetical protein
VRLQELLQLYDGLFADRLVISFLPAVLPLPRLPRLLLTLLLPLLLIVLDEDGLPSEDLLVLLPVLHVLGEVLVEEDVPENKQNFSDFGSLLPVLQDVRHTQVQNFLHVVDGDANTAQVLDQLVPVRQDPADVLNHHAV